MKLALQQAQKGKNTWTNPKVGAVIIKDGRVIGMGYHETFGHEHAEINALKSLPRPSDANNASIYVTLEPCAHFGKTPPCVQRLVESGIKKVVIGAIDPNPLVSGKGVSYLKNHHVEVEIQPVHKDFNQAYNFYYHHQRPLVTMKYAMTLDGKVNQLGDKRSLISNRLAYEDSQSVRSQNQAILIGEKTFRIDDPMLTVRTKKMLFPPLRIVLINKLTHSDLDRKLFADPKPILILANQSLVQELPEHVEVLMGDWTPKNIIELLYQRGIQSLLVEGGSSTQAKFLAANLVDRLIIYLAPKVFGLGLSAINGQVPVTEFEQPEIEILAEDLKITTWRKPECSQE